MATANDDGTQDPQEDPYAAALRAQMAQLAATAGTGTTSPVTGSTSATTGTTLGSTTSNQSRSTTDVPATNESYDPGTGADVGTTTGTTGTGTTGTGTGTGTTTGTTTSGATTTPAFFTGSFAGDWPAGATQPTNAPPGYHWDPAYANYVQDTPGTAATTTPTTTTSTAGAVAPTGGQLTDPAYAAKFVAYWGAQPGANPSVARDPNYWIGRFTSGAFGNDQTYAIKRMMQAEGAPETGTSTLPAGHTNTSQAPLSAQTSTFGDSDQGAGVGADLLNSLIARLLGGSATVAGTGATAAAAPNSLASPEDLAFRTQLMHSLGSLISQGEAPVGDVSNTPQARAFQLATQRNADQAQSAAAEKRTAQGLGANGALDQDTNAIQQQKSQAQAGYEAQITQTILDDKRQKLEYAITQGAGFLTSQQTLQLQQQLQTVNAALAQNQLQLNAANALLQNQRFYDDLGYRIGVSEQSGNAAAASSILGG